MKWSDEVGQEILGAIQARLEGGRINPCPLCGAKNWNLQSRFVAIQTTDEPQQISLGGNVLPSVVIVCSRCGNTHFLNLKVLGLTHLLTPSASVSPSTSASPSTSPSASPSPSESESEAVSKEDQ